MEQLAERIRRAQRLDQACQEIIFAEIAKGNSHGRP